MKQLIGILLCIIMIAVLTGCGKANDTASDATKDTVSATQMPTSASEVPTQAATAAPTQPPQAAKATDEPRENPPTQAEEVQQEKVLEMKIADTPVTVAWEDNEAVAALKEYCRDQILTIPMSMYGGFEQVGSIGTTLPRNDVQTTTQSGDIMLYSGNQLVVFYGSNDWAYTRLGHITDKSQDELTALLSNGDISISLEY
nr:cyclophilin-like fold protein [uncultured Ruminococcus sp.]